LFHFKLAEDTGSPFFKLARFAEEIDRDDDSLDYRYNGDMDDSDDELDTRIPSMANTSKEDDDKKMFSAHKPTSSKTSLFTESR